jgi:hypothetical protein
VPEAVSAVQRTALDVVQAEAALPVFDNFAGSSRQLLDLVPAEQGNANAHPAISYAIRTGSGQGDSKIANRSRLITMSNRDPGRSHVRRQPPLPFNKFPAAFPDYRKMAFSFPE